jgi:hypothetical protein
VERCELVSGIMRRNLRVRISSRLLDFWCLLNVWKSQIGVRGNWFATKPPTRPIVIAADVSRASAALAAVTQLSLIVTMLVVAGAGSTAICADLGAPARCCASPGCPGGRRGS